MTIGQSMWEELALEGTATRQVLERVPGDKFDWKPHEKSLPMGQLASHVADIPGWAAMTIEQDVLDLAASPPQFAASNAAELISHFDAQMALSEKALRSVQDDALNTHWLMKMGETTLIDAPKGQVLRRWVLNHVVHHRSQLAVYLRLNDLPVPAIYGASADEQSFQ